MYEWYEDEGLWNIDINRSFYEDFSIGEFGIEDEVVILENDLYRFTLEPLNSEEILCYKIYKKDKEIYDICRISFFKESYIESNVGNSFKLNQNELFFFNQLIDSPTVMLSSLEDINNNVSDMVFEEDENHNLVRNNKYEKLSKLWNNISLDQILQYKI